MVDISPDTYENNIYKMICYVWILELQQLYWPIFESLHWQSNGAIWRMSWKWIVLKQHPWSIAKHCDMVRLKATSMINSQALWHGSMLNERGEFRVTHITRDWLFVRALWSKIFWRASSFGTSAKHGSRSDTKAKEAPSPHRTDDAWHGLGKWRSLQQ